VFVIKSLRRLWVFSVVIHTFEFVKLFPIKIYQNYFRKESDADRCY